MKLFWKTKKMSQTLISHEVSTLKTSLQKITIVVHFKPILSCWIYFSIFVPNPNRPWNPVMLNSPVPTHIGISVSGGQNGNLSYLLPNLFVLNFPIASELAWRQSGLPCRQTGSLKSKKFKPLHWKELFPHIF